MDESLESVPAPFVVRRPGTWWWAPVPVDRPVAVPIDRVLAEVDPPAPAGPSTSPMPPALDPSSTVAPVWCWVGRLTRGGVLIEGNDGTTLVLDRDDLLLLDALDGPTTPALLATATGIPDAARRLARLAAAGRLRRPGPVPDTPVEQRHPEDDTVAVRPGSSAAPAPRDGRIGVHAVWQERVGPALSLGMLTAAARHWDDGALTATYAIRAPQTADEFLDDLSRGQGPAVLLCSNYVWSVDDNLEVARRAKAIRPDLVVVHGGPSTPKYPEDARRFLDDHADVADVLVRGEGEVVLCQVLEALAAAGGNPARARFDDVPGLSYRDPCTSEIRRTGEPERIADLDTLPSPYLTGEFDHIDPDAWHFAVSVETNRGCPYGCTFCDWGSATLSRIRKFDLDRVRAELAWAAERGVAGIQICDANFGIMSRDVEIARSLAVIRRETGSPACVSFTPAKNTTRHLTQIFDAVIEAGLLVSTAISLQTIDEGTLDAVARSNISTDGYLALAADLRRRGLPLQGDLLIGLPGQTYQTYKADLQFFIDHEISPRSWSLRTLPNAPMNDPDYRARYGIQVDHDQIVARTSTMTPAARERMLRLRKVQVVAEQYGVLAQVMRFLQWDHGLAITDLLDHLVDLTASTPSRFPLITWVFEYFDLHPTAPVGWRSFLDEVGRLVAEDHGIHPGSSAMQTVLAVQAALLPAPQRTFPLTITLEHDYVAYHRDATAELHASGRAAPPPRPLHEYPAAELTVTGDPLDLCGAGLHFAGDSRDESMLGQFWIGVGSSHELLSPLTRVSPTFRDDALAGAATGPSTGAFGGGDDPTPVTLNPRAPRSATTSSAW